MVDRDCTFVLNVVMVGELVGYFATDKTNLVDFFYKNNILRERLFSYFFYKHHVVFIKNIFYKYLVTGPQEIHFQSYAIWPN